MIARWTVLSPALTVHEKQVAWVSNDTAIGKILAMNVHTRQDTGARLDVSGSSRKCAWEQCSFYVLMDYHHVPAISV